MSINSPNFNPCDEIPLGPHERCNLATSQTTIFKVGDLAFRRVGNDGKKFSAPVRIVEIASGPDDSFPFMDLTIEHLTCVDLGEWGHGVIQAGARAIDHDFNLQKGNVLEVMAAIEKSNEKQQG